MFLATACNRLIKLILFMPIVIHSALAEVTSESWNALIQDDYPFIKHEFLSALETTGCVTPETGWIPSHIVNYADDNRTILCAMPCYEKSHSYGEYIFDWAWADAYFRHGISYYPKLSTAIPFTPATGQRVLASKNTVDPYPTLVDATQFLCHERELSGWHGLFLNSKEIDQFAHDSNYLVRHSNQFHWQNHNYSNFSEFLASLNSKKRKNIKRERRRIVEMDVQYRWLSGEDLTTEVMHTMYRFYQRTIALYGAQSYLNKPFFEFLGSSFNRNTMVLFAYYNDQIIAGGLYFKGDSVLYGRYWGALHNFHSVHFETCYYQAIQWCIEHGYERFEAGAQGEHKLARGLSPSTTYSAHWFVDERFQSAIGEYVTQEQHHVAEYQHKIAKHSPYRNEI